MRRIKFLVFLIVVALIVAGIYLGPSGMVLLKYKKLLDDYSQEEFMNAEVSYSAVANGAEQGIFAVNIKAEGFKAMYPKKLELKEVTESFVRYEGKGPVSIMIINSTMADKTIDLKADEEIEPDLKMVIGKLVDDAKDPYEFTKEIVFMTPKEISIFDKKSVLMKKLALLEIKFSLFPDCKEVQLMDIGSSRVVQYTMKEEAKQKIVYADLFTDKGSVSIIVEGVSSQEELNGLYKTAVIE